MQTPFNETKKQSLLSSALGMVGNNKRYLFWFWLLNLTLAEFGTAAFRQNANPILNHSLHSDRLVHGFDLSVLVELLFRPEFGPLNAARMPAFYFSVLFMAATALFLPGVFWGYASRYRLPREEFFRACGRNLWRFIRLMMIAGIVMGIIAGILFAITGFIVKKAGESTNELLPFTLQMVCLAVIFLKMTTLRIWFDLAEADIVLNDQRAVRRSIAAGFRHTLRSLTRLLGSYVFTTVIAAIILAGGLLAWMKLVAPESVIGAFVITQLILFFLLIPRFWQRGIAVSYWQQHMLQPVAAPEPVATQPIVPIASPAPAMPIIPVPAPPVGGEA
jgi:hypothetical protein